MSVTIGLPGSRRTAEATTASPRSRCPAGTGGTGQAWITMVGTRCTASGGSSPRDAQAPRETVIRTDASASGPSSPSAASSSRSRRPAAPPPRRAARSRGRRRTGGARRRARRSSVIGRPSRGASRRCRRPAGSRGRTRTGAGRPRAAPRRPPRRTADRRRSRPPPPRRSSRAARAPSRRLVPLVRRVAAPGDAAADVERQPFAVRHERPDQDRRAEPPVRPQPEHGPAVRAAADGLQPLDDLHRPDLGRAGDRAAGEGGGEQVEGVRVRRGAARSPWSPGAGRRRCAPGAGAAGRGPSPARRPARDRCAARPRSSRSRRWSLRAGDQLARQRAILLAGPAPRAGALDRVGGDARRRVHREERLGRGREERARARRWRATARGPGSRRTARDRRCGGGGRCGHGSPPNGASRRRVRFAW